MKLKFTQLGADKKFVNITILVVLFIVIFLTSILARIYLFDNASLPGKEAYFSVNIAKDISSFKGNFVLKEFALSELIWPVMIALFSFILRVPLEFSLIFLSLIFGVLSVILIYLIIDKMGFKKRNLALGFFLISPATIWLFSTFSKFVVPFFLALLTLHLLLMGKTAISFLAVAATSIFGATSSISVLAFSILSFKKGFWKWFWKAFLIALAINFIMYLFFPFLGTSSFNFGSFFALFSSLSEFGVSVFAFLLAFIAIFFTWKVRKERRDLFSIYFVFVLLFMFSITNKEFVFFFNFVLIFLAAIGFTKLLEREWASSLIRNLTLAILIVGLLIPLVFMPLRLASSEPEDSLVDSLEFLREKEYGVVLSVKENGYWIRSFSGKGAFVDEFKARVEPEFEERAIGFLRERNLEKLGKKFKEEGIRYIFLDGKTKQLFRTEEEGILLLLRHTKSFIKIYDKDEIEIWEFVG